MSLWKCTLFLLFHQMSPASPLSYSLLVPAIVLIPSCRSLVSLRIFPSTVSAFLISDPSTVAAIFQSPILPLCSTSSLNSIFGTLPSGSSLAMEAKRECSSPQCILRSHHWQRSLSCLQSAPDTLISVSVLCRKGLEVSFKYTEGPAIYLQGKLDYQGKDFSYFCFNFSGFSWS